MPKSVERCVKKVIASGKPEGAAWAICQAAHNKAMKSKNSLFADSINELPFIVHKHSVGDKVDYQLSIKTGNELQYLVFPSQARETLVNAPNITRLFGRESEDTRTDAWLTFSGTTKNSEGEVEVDGQMKPIPGIYEIFDQGVLKIGLQDDHYSELYFKGNVLTDRWILRRIPNIFDTAKFGESEELLLLWKPPMQKSYNQAFDLSVSPSEVKCLCPVDILSAKFAEVTGKEEGIELTSKFSTNIDMYNPETQQFEGTAASVGTVVDFFGNKYTYTPEFLTHLYNEQKSKLQSGEITPIIEEHSLDGDEVSKGSVTDCQLVHEPLLHIRVNGNYNGPLTLSEGDAGLSYELRLKSTWSDEFQSWVPFSAKIDKLSVVRHPACKICWVNKVK